MLSSHLEQVGSMTIPALPLPPALDALELRPGGTLSADETAWLAKPENRRRLLAALAAPDLELVARASLTESWARFLLAVQPTAGWSEVMGFALDRVPNWLPHCIGVLETFPPQDRATADAWLAFARALVDRTVPLWSAERREELLVAAEGCCARSRAAGGTPHELQSARILFLRHRPEEAVAAAERRYAANPQARDGYTALAWLARAEGNLEQMFALLARDRREQRQSPAAMLEYAGLLLRHERWREGAAIINSPVFDGPKRDEIWKETARELFAETRDAFRRQGSTRRIRVLLREWINLHTGAGARNLATADTAQQLAVAYAILGDDAAVAKLLGLSGPAPREPEAVRLRCEVARVLLDGGETVRGVRLLESVFAKPGFTDVWVSALIDGRAKLGAAADVRAALVDAEPRYPNLRGVRTRIAERLLAGLQQEWIRTRDGRPPSAGTAQEIRRWIAEEQAAGRTVGQSEIVLARLELLEGNGGAARARIEALYRREHSVAEGYSQLGALLLAAHRPHDARMWFELELAAGRPRSALTQFRHAAVLASLGDEAGAHRLVEAVYATDSTARGGHTLVALDYFSGVIETWDGTALGPEAEALARKAIAACGRDIDAGRDTTETRFLIARCEWLRGRHDSAVRCLGRLRAKFPLLPDLFGELAALARRVGQMDAMLDLSAKDQTAGLMTLGRMRTWIQLLARYGRSRQAREAALAEQSMLARPAAQVAGRLHAVNAFAGFDAKAIPEDRRGWHHGSAIFEELIHEVKPRLIIEVGTWKGGSAIAMAQACQAAKFATPVVCVDTWLGAVEFWLDQTDADRFQSLGLRHGYPSVYYQFLANCVHQGVSDRIIPFPQSSTSAALWFVLEGFRAELIYVDASHTYDDVLRDARAYWDALRPGGVMFGDDFALPDVKAAVATFSKEVGVPAVARHDCWVMKKPAG